MLAQDVKVWKNDRRIENSFDPLPYSIYDSIARGFVFRSLFLSLEDAFHAKFTTPLPPKKLVSN